MEGSIVKTTLNKGLIAVSNFIILLLTTQLLGPEVRGEIALLVLAITISALISQMVGGPAIVYLSHEKRPSQMLLPSYIWAVMSGLGCNVVMTFLDLLPEKLLFNSIALSILHSLGLFHGFILLAKQKIKNYNILLLLQSLTSLIVLALALSLEISDVSAFVSALAVSYSLYFLLSFFFSLPYFQMRKDWLNIKQFPSLFGYGIITQTANIAHLLSNRFSFFVVERFVGLVALGIFSAGVALSETMLIFSGSASMIMYSKISKEGKTATNIYHTYVWSKISFWLIALLMMVLVLLPSTFYQFLLGASFGEVSEIILFLAPGLIFMSASSLLSHYFSGTGRFRISTAASLLAFVISALCAVPLTLLYSLHGAALSVSAGMMASGIYLFVIFNREYKLSLNKVFPDRNDFAVVRNEFKHIIKSNQS
ncbi:MAG: lipopolysaccharide biosynthesis protein [Flavobacteriales bacterium]